MPRKGSSAREEVPREFGHFANQDVEAIVEGAEPESMPSHGAAPGSLEKSDTCPFRGPTYHQFNPC